MKIHPAYALLGPETGKKSTYIKSIHAQCNEAYGGASELHRFYPFETENGEALEVLLNSSLFADHRLVIISQADKLSQVTVQSLCTYLDSPVDDATLVLVSSENSISKKLQKMIPSQQVVMFWELFEDQKLQWLEEFFSSRGMEITEEAAALFLDLVENNTQEMRTVAMMFCSYLNTLNLGDPVTVTDAEVESFVYHSKKENVFSLFAKIVQRDFPGTLEIYRTMELAGEMIPAPFFAGLLWQFRRLLHLLELMQQRWLPEEAMERTMVLGKKAPIKGRRNAAVYLQGAKHYSIPQVRSIIIALQECESLLREIRSDMHSLAVEMMLYRIVVKSGTPPYPGEAFYGLVGVNCPQIPSISL